MGVLGYLMGVPSYWAFPFNGRSEGDYSKETIRRSGAHDIFGVAHTIFFGSGAHDISSGIDEWKGRCNFPPAGGKLHLPRFTINGRYRKTEPVHE